MVNCENIMIDWLLFVFFPIIHSNKNKMFSDGNGAHI